MLNTRAVEVMKRMSDKLMGRDYPTEGVAGGGGQEPDSVYSQVQRLILAAISHENLCQSYIGCVEGSRFWGCWNGVGLQRSTGCWSQVGVAHHCIEHFYCCGIHCCNF